MEARQNKSFVKGAAILAVAGLIVKIIGAFFRIPLANTVGTVGMAYYEVAYPYYSWLLVISTAGFPTAISKLVSEKVTLGDYRGAHTVFRTALLLLAIIGLLSGLLMFFGADFLASISTFDKASLSFKALAPALLFVAVLCAFRGYLQGLQSMTGTAISQVVEQVGKLAIGLTLAIKMLPMGPEYAAMGALIGVSASELIALGVIAGFYYFRRRHGLSRKLARAEQASAARGSVIKSIVLIAIPITIGASISPLTGIVDSAIIGRVLDKLGFAKEAAQTAYSLLRTNVTTLVNMPGVLTMALAMSLVPSISSAMAARRYSGVRTATRLGMKLAMVVGMPCAAGLFVLSEPVLKLLYVNLNAAELALASELLKTAAIGVIFLSLVQSMTGVIQGMGKPNVPVFNLFIGFMLKVATMLILMNIPNINIQGAAISTVVCYAFAGIADTVFAARRTGIKLKVFDTFLKPLLASAAMGAIVWLCYSTLAKGGHTTLATIAAVVAGIVVYVVLLLVLRIFNEDELDLIPGGGRLKKLMAPKKRADRA